MVWHITRRPLGRFRRRRTRPWGGGGGQSGQQPPDIEEMLKRSQAKFKKLLPSGAGGPKRIILLVLAAIIIWLGTGFYRVQPSEQGVELLFGKFVQMTTPGLNYWFPSPIGQVFTPDVTNTNITSVGFREVGSGGARRRACATSLKKA